MAICGLKSRMESGLPMPPKFQCDVCGIGPCVKGYVDHRMSPPDPVNHPKHYTAHPSGFECITITEHMGFNLGNAMKYIWRADLKNNAIEDLEKAKWYLTREIEKRKSSTTATSD